MASHLVFDHYVSCELPALVKEHYPDPAQPEAAPSPRAMACTSLKQALLESWRGFANTIHKRPRRGPGTLKLNEIAAA